VVVVPSGICAKKTPQPIFYKGCGAFCGDCFLESIQIHHFIPCGDEVFDEFFS
jgi:hypothetical protein